MFSIGDFAKLGRVSVRMLRHYDAIGLLTPAAVDPASGYRFYNAEQLSRLNRLIALKDLGFTLQQVQAILDERVDVVELRGMLRLRRAQLEAQIAADEVKLASVEARLRTIELEGCMTTLDVVLKDVPPIRVAELEATAAGYGPEHIGPVIQPLYATLFERLAAAGVTPVGPAIAYYETGSDETGTAGTGSGERGSGETGSDGAGDAVTVHAAAPVACEARPGMAFAIVDLPATALAATVVHHGSMDHVMPTVQALGRWIEENGYRPVGYHREVYLDYYPERADQGVTELQVGVVKA